jgi:hypothetical protein
MERLPARPESREPRAEAETEGRSRDGSWQSSRLLAGSLAQACSMRLASAVWAGYGGPWTAIVSEGVRQ